MLLNIVKKALVNWQNLNSVIHSSLSNLSGDRALVIITRILSSTNEVTTHMKMRLTDRNHKLISNSEIMLKNQTYLRTREKSPRFIKNRLCHKTLSWKPCNGSYYSGDSTTYGQFHRVRTHSYQPWTLRYVRDDFHVAKSWDFHANEERGRTSRRRRTVFTNIFDLLKDIWTMTSS